MLTNEAAKILGAAMMLICTKSPGHELISHALYNAIVEEWFNGSVEIDNLETIIENTVKYKGNVYKQAARVLAGNIELYGDVE